MTWTTNPAELSLDSDNYSKFNEMRLCSIYIALIFFMTLNRSAFAVDSVNEPVVESIAVSCTFRNDIPLQVQKRLKDTLVLTLEKILLESENRSVENYIAARDEIQANILDGLNFVFKPKGYEVEQLSINFDTITKADFILKSFGTYVETVDYKLNTDNLNGFWDSHLQDMFNDAIPDLKAHYEPVLKGLPVNAEHTEWAFSLISDEFNDTSCIDARFMDMKIEVSVSLDKAAIVSFKLHPQGHVVKTLRVRSYSRSMFQLALDPLKELITSHSDIAVGMPFSMLELKKTEIEKEFVRLLLSDEVSRKFELEFTCRLYYVEEDPDAAYVEFTTESRIWNFSAVANIDVGNDESPTEFEAHMGIRAGDFIEGFVLLNFFPDDIRFRPDIGVGINPSNSTFAACGWDITDGFGKLYFNQYFTPLIRVEAEVFTGNRGQDQYGVVYKPFQFVSFGLFTNGDDDYWLRASFAF
jgi:hypothetical protein